MAGRRHRAARLPRSHGQSIGLPAAGRPGTTAGRSGRPGGWISSPTSATLGGRGRRRGRRARRRQEQRRSEANL